MVTTMAAVMETMEVDMVDTITQVMVDMEAMVSKADIFFGRWEFFNYKCFVFFF